MGTETPFTAQNTQTHLNHEKSSKLEFLILGNTKERMRTGPRSVKANILVRGRYTTPESLPRTQSMRKLHMKMRGMNQRRRKLPWRSRSTGLQPLPKMSGREDSNLTSHDSTDN